MACVLCQKQFVSQPLSIAIAVCPVLIFCPAEGKKGSPYSITERRVPELIPVLGSQPAGDMSQTRQ